MGVELNTFWLRLRLWLFVDFRWHCSFLAAPGVTEVDDPRPACILHWESSSSSSEIRVIVGILNPSLS